MSASIGGLEQLNNNFSKLLSNMDSVNNKALRDVGLDLLGKSVDLAPVDKGDLRGSGSSHFEDNTVTVGFSEPYAVSQHEHLEYEHPKGGQAKYLEKPFRENADKYINYIADANKKALK